MTTRSSVLAFASVHAAGLAFVLAVAAPAHAQVNDAQRAAARDLFKAGDQAQRAGQFAEALDKFQRAQQVYPAPTNLLRIAECDAALGRLVESAEAYRDVQRTPLPAGSPPAFQAAVDQAKAELSQVEPRVPRLTVQVLPNGVQSPQMQIDGQSVPSALIGEPMPLDPGTHKLAVIASGYASTEQSVDLKERETKAVSLTLNAIPGVTYAPAGAAAPVAAGPAPETPPPPPPIAPPDEGPLPKRSSAGFLVGLHLGIEGMSGQVPTPTAGFTSAGDVGSGGLSFGFDSGFRFARHFYAGVALDRANFNGGTTLDGTATDASSNTTYFGVVGAVMTNPDHVSFYFELALGERWLDVREGAATIPASNNHKIYSAGEAGLGVGIWIPVGKSFRLLPKLSFGFTSFSQDSSGSSDSTSKIVTFTSLSLTGAYNLDF
jgi:hypothetical protein